MNVDIAVIMLMWTKGDSVNVDLGGTRLMWT